MRSASAGGVATTMNRGSRSRPDMLATVRRAVMGLLGKRKGLKKIHAKVQRDMRHSVQEVEMELKV